MDTRRKARADADLRHALHGFRGGVTAGEDLRVNKPDGSGIRPGILHMLFAGGVAKPPYQKAAGLFRGGRADRMHADDDLRRGRHENIRPAMGKPLFKGGPTRGVASKDLRMHHDGEDEIEPANFKNLDHGGEIDGDGFEGQDVGEGLIIAAEEIMDCLGSYYGASLNDSDNKVERASKEASRRAKAKILAQALKAFFLMVDSDDGDDWQDGE